ncbi:MAG: hypothetical protein F8N36_14105 [Desulfovibrio sp.]|uniref:hypothetical protein n=1 Tax=Desulfovibrio sp. TaxID=885 RepID=UPI00135E72EA|nr:hypothetical protein [Desulfovibrio sp.]MTJ93972.1 hypothetical protein [Desulfovibrio sp.]
MKPRHKKRLVCGALRLPTRRERRLILMCFLGDAFSTLFHCAGYITTVQNDVIIYGSYGALFIGLVWMHCTEIVQREGKATWGDVLDELRILGRMSLLSCSMVGALVFVVTMLPAAGSPQFRLWLGEFLENADAKFKETQSQHELLLARRRARRPTENWDGP